jgi:hypothetical protein
LVQQAGARLQDDQVWKQFENLETYAQRLLKWTAEIHETASRTDISLFDCTAFSSRDPESNEIELRDEREFRRRRFGVLDRPNSESETDELSNVWNRLSSASSPRDVGGAGSFIQALHEACNPDNFSS